MKKILFYISPEKHPSPFDITAAYDGGADIVVPYSNVLLEDVPGIIYDVVFSRSPKELVNSAIFIGGHDVNLGEEIFKLSVKTFPGPFKVSIVADPDGCNTTSSACVAKIKKAIDLKGKKAVILAGTGPVGQRIAYLLAKEGCFVEITSRKLDRAKKVCDSINEIYKVNIAPVEVNNDELTRKCVSDSDIVVSTGPPKVCMVKKEIWLNSKAKVLVDANAAPPYGIEGVDANDDYKEIEGRIGIGALAVGVLKMKIHHGIISKMFEKKTFIDLDQIYSIALKEVNIL